MPSKVTSTFTDKVPELWDAVERLLARVLKEWSRINYRLDMHQDEVQELDNLQAQIEALKYGLMEHPAYNYRTLVLPSGKLKSDKTCINKYGQGYDGIAQELGYEQEKVQVIGHTPSHDMNSDDRFKYDLNEIYKVMKQLRSLNHEYSQKKEELKAKILIKPKREDMELDEEEEPTE
jgi:hypothetical protein